MGALALVTDVVRVWVEAPDPLLRAGVEDCLRDQPGLVLAGDAGPVSAVVSVVVAEEVDDETLRVVSAARRAGRPVLLVVTSIDKRTGLAIRAGAGGVLLREDATADRLLGTIRALVDGYGTLPPDLLAELLASAVPVLTDREKNVLRLLADGLETAEVARRLAYSVRTVTAVVHAITRRLRLRNRAHAVAFAVREGLI